MGGWLTGLMSAAVFAASSHFAFGRTLGRQTRVGSKRGFGLDFVMAAPPSFRVVYAERMRAWGGSRYDGTHQNPFQGDREAHIEKVMQALAGVIAGCAFGLAAHAATFLHLQS